MSLDYLLDIEEGYPSPSFSVSSMNHRLNSLSRSISKIFFEIIWLLPAAFPVVSTFVFAPLSLYHVVYAYFSDEKDRKHQIVNALGCAILATPILGQFYLFKTMSQRTIRFGLNREVYTYHAIEGRVASKDPLFCCVVRYMFLEAQMREFLEKTL